MAVYDDDRSRGTLRAMFQTRRLALVLLAAASSALLLAAACGLTVTGRAPLQLDAGSVDGTPTPGADVDVPDAEQTGSDAGTDGASEGGSVRCPSGRGPTMVLGADGDFCIDSTEVTNAQYLGFLSAVGTDKTFTEAVDGGPPAICVPFPPFDASGLDSNDAFPIHGVSWCDAWAYCLWSGKRLCSGAVDDTSDGGRSDEWSRACSNDGKNAYPYGPSEIDGACVIKVSVPEPVGTAAQCRGGYPGLDDMVGNVAEFVDLVGGVGFRAGGTWVDTTASCSTRQRSGNPENTQDFYAGIRCCADPRL
jgi:formylglycine-generating enzyme required for sulfatase activity